MVSNITMEETLLDMPEGVILESWSGSFDVQESRDEASVRIEPEYEDDLVLALAWIKNIG